MEFYGEAHALARKDAFDRAAAESAALTAQTCDASGVSKVAWDVVPPIGDLQAALVVPNRFKSTTLTSTAAKDEEEEDAAMQDKDNGNGDDNDTDKSAIQPLVRWADACIGKVMTEISGKKKSQLIPFLPVQSTLVLNFVSIFFFQIYSYCIISSWQIKKSAWQCSSSA